LGATTFNLISPLPYTPPVPPTGLVPGSRIENLQQTAQINTQNAYGPGSIDEINIPVAREQRLYGLNPFTKPQIDPTKQTASPINVSYETPNINFPNIDRIKENFSVGLSPRPFGPLGDNAINGQVGRQLNIVA